MGPTIARALKLAKMACLQSGKSVVKW
jgi:hypothetical protein